MIVDKSKILEVLRARGQHARADWVDRQLPDDVDTYDNASLLATLGLNPADLNPTDLNPTDLNRADIVDPSP
jgi:hypothetical protein